MRMGLAVAAVLAVMPGTAHAHPGEPGALGVVDGMLHPLSGADHIAAVVLLGMLCEVHKLGPGLAGAFLLGVPLGLGWAAAGQIGAEHAELAVAASLGLMGILLLTRRALPGLAMAVGAVSGLAHGAAHGLAGPTSVSFSCGVMISTTALLAVSWAAVSILGLLQHSD